MSSAGTRADRGASAGRTVLRVIDRAFLAIGLAALVGVVVVVSYQVVLRTLFDTTPSWSDPVARLCMVWMGFAGIAIGVRRQSHIGIELFQNRIKGAAALWLRRGADLLALAFGLFLVVQGWEFTTLAMATKIPPTPLPGGVLYAILPISGAMMALYSALHLVGFDWQDRADETDLAPATADHPAGHVPVEREAAG